MTNEQKLACARRELLLRKYVYPGRVSAKKMTQATADYEIECMVAIVEDYRILCEGTTSEQTRKG